METKRIYIVNNALEIIKDECWKFKKLEIECGGSLLGFRHNGSSITIYALRTGLNANQSYGGIITDSTYQNNMAKKICDFYPNVKKPLRYLADYHLHPMFHPSLSATDHKQCFGLLTDPDYDYLEELSIVLVTFDQNNKMIICPYVVSLDENEELLIKRAKLEVIASDAEIVTEFLNGNYVSVDAFSAYEREESVKEIGIAAFLEKGFYETKFGKELVEQEKAGIAELIGCEPKIGYLKNTNILCLDFEYNEYAFRLVFPPEYPLNPPTVFYQTKGMEDFDEVRFSFHWNSLCSLSDLIKDM